MSSVLLIDDEQQLREQLRPLLEARTVRLFEACSIREADEVMAGQTPDLIVVNGLLPDGAGVDWIERLRVRNKAARVIFLAAFRNDLIESSVVNVGKANAPTDGRLPSQHIINHTGLNKTIQRLVRELDVSLVLHKPVSARELDMSIKTIYEQVVKSNVKPPAPNSIEPSVDAELRELQEMFAASLPGKIDEMESAILLAQSDPARVPEAKSHAHRLRGSAGSYGFPAVGAAAGVIEDLLAEACSAGGEQRPRLWDDVRRALASARNALASRQADKRAGGGAAQTSASTLFDENAGIRTEKPQ
jgi:CheY-like chemotaxis protein